MKYDDGAPHALDLELGLRFRERRRAMGLSQERLADALGVSFQQVQKYVRGANRVSFSRLVATTEALDCNLDQLTEGFVGPRGPDNPSLGLLRIAGALELLEAYSALGDGALQRAVIDHMRSLARVAAALPRRPASRG
ncbi:MAG: helix-turn-helix transcriptional regulator [Phenylobacterium sp.]|uniref:helix-turn-helix domain-containing protein n=1 Tax=Phenylobacterium sp. TaxID=1871053 RepID=UPI002734B950|nr:helix-turn-helix transcriptional regulator [Phenylobacterium sp.]MDP3749272.1 helix-turn-helix transcriptional regulator [Phenylobacterium sp.]